MENDQLARIETKIDDLTTRLKQDQSDLTAASLQYAAKLYPEEEDLV